MERVTKIVKKTSETISLNRGFRANADVENFYRFISENDLRREAKLALEAVMYQITKGKKKSKSKKSQSSSKKSKMKVQ